MNSDITFLLTKFKENINKKNGENTKAKLEQIAMSLNDAYI